MKRNITDIPAFRSLLLLMAAALVVSCSDFIFDYEGDCSEPGSGPRVITGFLNVDLEVHTPGKQRQLPARGGRLDDDRENLITDAAVLLFIADDNGNPDKFIDVLTPYLLERDQNDNTLYHANFATPLTEEIISRRLRVGILANGASILEPLQQAKESGQTLTMNDVRQLLTSKLSDSSTNFEDMHDPLTPSDEGAPFVMWGLPNNIIKADKEATFVIEACLMRSLARFDIALGDELQKSGLFDFRSVYFFKPSNTVVHIPEQSRIAATADETGHPYYYTTSPTLDSDNRVFYHWDYPETVENGDFSYTCYVPEGEVIMKGKNGGVGKPRDINHPVRPAVIVGGYFNGASVMSYYRIDICNEEGNLIDILRNHLYKIIIRSVLGPGQPTPEEAYDNNNITIVAEITDWCLVDNDVMYNGADWISVTTRTINLTGNAGAGTTFIINSSVPLSQWEFKLGEDGDFTTANLLESDNFFVTRPIQERGSRILVVTKRTLPAGESPVTERLYVRIGGRVLFYITITQYPLQSDYWFLGDTFLGNSGPWTGVIDFPIGGEDPDIPPGSFIDFLRWLFGGNFSGTIGDGDNVSDSEYVNDFFWKFITWFFTDEYGHVIGGTPEDWNEDWSHPIAIIIFDFVKWMLGDDYYREIEGPDLDPYDPNNPSYTTVGALIAMRFMEWLRVQEFLKELEGFDDTPYDPNNPDYTTIGSEVLMKFLAWVRQIDFTGILEGFTGAGGGGPGEEETTFGSIDTLLSLLDWYSGAVISKNIGGDEGNPDNPDKPDDPTVIPGNFDHDAGDWDGNHGINKDIFIGEE